VDELSAVSHSISGLSGTIGDIANKADTVATRVNGMVYKLNRGEGTIGALLSERTIYDSLLFVVHNAIALTEEAKAGAGKFDEDMEALKHNFFFKGYFEDRGYWDKADYEKESVIPAALLE
jgi:phospholipid/cholesterol/gamma-HCH transport system substrate-binding protein